MPDPVKPFEIVADGDIDIVHISLSKMPYAALESLQAALATAIDAGSRKMIIDLSSVAFVDSFGIGVLVATSRRMAQVGGELRLSGPGERVMMSLTITRLDRTLHIVDDTAAAIRSLRAKS